MTPEQLAEYFVKYGETTTKTFEALIIRIEKLEAQVKQLEKARMN